jgi:class 3 adenylate cyclase
MEAGTQHTFMFADLVGFTAFTEHVGDDAAADVAVAFQAAASHIAATYDCEVIKSLGDAVMVRGDSAARVVGLALQLARELTEEAWCPPLRIGVHSGTAVQRRRDWYGATVNVAARLADAASAGEVLISAATRTCLATREGLTIADRGARQFKNVAAPLSIYSAT